MNLNVRFSLLVCTAVIMGGFRSNLLPVRFGTLLIFIFPVVGMPAGVAATLPAIIGKQ
jgi:hypothetical protein